MGTTLQAMVWVTTGGECVDTVCRLQTTTSRESVRETVEAGPRLYEVYHAIMRVRISPCGWKVGPHYVHNENRRP